jgi:hypothetical protein
VVLQNDVGAWYSSYCGRRNADFGRVLGLRIERTNDGVKYYCAPTKFRRIKVMTGLATW